MVVVMESCKDLIDESMFRVVSDISGFRGIITSCCSLRVAEAIML